MPSGLPRSCSSCPADRAAGRSCPCPLPGSSSASLPSREPPVGCSSQPRLGRRRVQPHQRWRIAGGSSGGGGSSSPPPWRQLSTCRTASWVLCWLVRAEIGKDSSNAACGSTAGALLRPPSRHCNTEAAAGMLHCRRSRHACRPNLTVTPSPSPQGRRRAAGQQALAPRVPVGARAVAGSVHRRPRSSLTAQPAAPHWQPGGLT